MAVSADYRRLLRKELKVRTIIQKSFKKQKKFLLDHVEDLYLNYRYNIELTWNNLNNAIVNLYPDKKDWYDVENDEPLGGFRKEMGVDDMIEDLRPQIKKAVERGYKRSFRLFEPLLLENGFSYYYDTIDNYARYWGEVNLSNYRGAISYTTKHDVIEILKNGIDNNLTVDEVAKQIEKKSEVLFGNGRANTIAVTEIGKAYEWGNYQPVQQLESVGVKMLKLWQTCDDARVRPEHMDCEMLGWVESDFVYPSTGLVIAGGPNCRCAMLYKRA